MLLRRTEDNFKSSGLKDCFESPCMSIKLKRMEKKRKKSCFFLYFLELILSAKKSTFQASGAVHKLCQPKIGVQIPPPPLSANVSIFHIPPPPFVSQSPHLPNPTLTWSALSAYALPGILK